MLASISKYGSTYYKWKNHFSEMKGDVGMSPHEKGGEQEDVYIHKDRKSFNPIPTSLYLLVDYSIYYHNIYIYIICYS